MNEASWLRTVAVQDLPVPPLSPPPRRKARYASQMPMSSGVVLLCCIVKADGISETVAAEAYAGTDRQWVWQVSKAQLKRPTMHSSVASRRGMRTSFWCHCSIQVPFFSAMWCACMMFRISSRICRQQNVVSD